MATETAQGTDTTRTSATTSTEFDRNVDDLLRSEQSQPATRKRSSMLLLIVAAIALIVFFLIFLAMRRNEREAENEPKGPASPNVDPADKPKAQPASRKSQDDSWVDPETKEWIEEVNKGKKK